MENLLMSQEYKVVKAFHDRKEKFKPLEIGASYSSSDEKRVEHLLMLGYIVKTEEVKKDGKKD